MVNAILAIVASVVSIWTIEIGLAIGHRFSNPEVWEQDQKSVLSEVLRLHLKGHPPYQYSVVPNEIEQRLGYPVLSRAANAVYVPCQEAGPPLVMTTDEQGFHNPPGLWRLQRWSIAILGDSFTEGYCVPSNRNSAALIRQTHPATVNLARAGDHPVHQYAKLREFAAPYRPDIVLWFFYEENDLVNILRLRGEGAHRRMVYRYLDDPNLNLGLLERQGEIDRMLAEEAAIGLRRLLAEHRLDPQRLDESAIDAMEAKLVRDRRAERWLYTAKAVLKLTHLRGRLNLLFLRRGHSPEEGAYPIFEAVMRDSRERIAAWGGRLIVIYIPSTTSFTARIEDPTRARVLEILARQQIPLIDMVPILLGTGKPQSHYAYGMHGGHFNEAGYRLTAEAVLKQLGEWSVPRP
ncbi:MAG: hypothetical protein FJX46_09520 [Alphaproteobacteria bacterium]|nr:hypothetical protein [Alphaproteobacteria bacterium]